MNIENIARALNSIFEERREAIAAQDTDLANAHQNGIIELAKLFILLINEELDPKHTVVLIPDGKYLALLRSSDMLSALEAGGVDNWEWYGESLKDFYKEEDDD